MKNRKKSMRRSKTYNAEEQQKIADKLEKKKESQEYKLSNMLIEYNPFGTNTQSLYVYFETDSAVKVSYTIHVKEDDLPTSAEMYIRMKSIRKSMNFR